MVRANYASYGARAGASLIDFALMIGILFALALLFTGGHVGGFFLFLPLVLFAGVLYKPLMEGARGQTLGKMALGIKVVRASDAGPIGYGPAFLRWLVAAVLGAVPLGSLVDHLWPLWDEHVQTLHDKAAGTIVVIA